MKKFIIIIGLIIIACESGIDINPACIMKHTGLVTRLQSSSTTLESAAANLSWTWVYGLPEGDGVIIERSLGGQYDSIDYCDTIQQLMTYTDAADTLAADMAVSYMLSLLTGKAVQYFDTVDFTLPSGQQTCSPDTEFVSFPNDTLSIIFKKLADYDTTDISLYKTSYAFPDSVLARPLEDIVNLLSSSIIDTTITDTILFLPADTLLIDKYSVYVLKISSSKNPTLDYITDTSIGLIVFKRY